MSLEIAISDKPKSPPAIFASASLPKESVSQRLRVNPAQIVRLMSGEVQEIALRLVRSDSAEHFRESREKLFWPYFNLLKSIKSMISLSLETVSSQESFVRDSLEELSADFEKQGKETLGAEATEQAIFAISTLTRTNRLITQIVCEGSTSPSRREEDRRLARECVLYGTWATLHLECLAVALERKERIRSDVLESILEGLRGVVRAYSSARQGCDLRKAGEPEVSMFPESAWDDEDEYLATQSSTEFLSAYDE